MSGWRSRSAAHVSRPGELGHVEVEQDDVRGAALGQGQRLAAVAGQAGDLDALVGAQQRRGPLAHETVVVDHEHGDRARRPSHRATYRGGPRWPLRRHRPRRSSPPVAIATVGSVARALVGAGHPRASWPSTRWPRCARPSACASPRSTCPRPTTCRSCAASPPPARTSTPSRLLDELRFEQEAWRLASAGGRALVFHEPATWLVANPFDPPASAWLVLPLDAGGEVLGVVAAAQRHPLRARGDQRDGARHPRRPARAPASPPRACASASRARRSSASACAWRPRSTTAWPRTSRWPSARSRCWTPIPTPEQAGESRARLREAVGAAHRIVRARLEDLSTRVPIGGLHDAVAAACDRAREHGLPVELRAAAAVEPAEPEATAVVAARARRGAGQRRAPRAAPAASSSPSTARAAAWPSPSRTTAAAWARSTTAAPATGTSASRSCASARRRSAAG